jgi:hypothetical protein
VILDFVGGVVFVCLINGSFLGVPKKFYSGGDRKKTETLNQTLKKDLYLVRVNYRIKTKKNQWW